MAPWFYNVDDVIVTRLHQHDDDERVTVARWHDNISAGVALWVSAPDRVCRVVSILIVASGRFSSFLLLSANIIRGRVGKGCVKSRIGTLIPYPLSLIPGLLQLRVSASNKLKNIYASESLPFHSLEIMTRQKYFTFRHTCIQYIRLTSK